MRAVSLVAVTAVVWLSTAAASGSVFAGHSGWFWGNPVPQGNTLQAVEFVGNRGYAVGSFGTVLRSDDAGASWTGITTGTTAPLRLVDVIAPDTIVIGGACAVQRSDDAGRSFRSLPWTPPGSPCRVPVRSLAFPSPDVGYLLLFNGTILRTRDGGRTWVHRTAIPGTPATTRNSVTHPTDVQFPGVDTGIVATEAGALYRTTDGGTSWAPVAAAPQHLDSISFPDPLTGYAVGGASVLKTQDGGVSWTQMGVVQPPESLSWIRCADGMKCVATTASGDELLRTDDGGATWTRISPSTRGLLASAYLSSGSVVAVGDEGVTVISPDGGHNFAPVSGELPGRFMRIVASSSRVAYAIGTAGAIARTEDGGADWSLLAAPSAAALRDVSFPTTDRGYAVDDDGSFLRTDDGGGSWRLLDTGTYLKPRAVLALDPAHVLLVGPRGVSRSSLGGFGLKRVRQPRIENLELTAAGATTGLVFAYGRHALVASLDDGETWRRLRVPEPAGVTVKVDFASDKIAYALTRDGRIWKTANRGGHWRELPAIGTRHGTDLAFSDPQNGYVAVAQFGDSGFGYVMRTSDGGFTWRPQLVDRARIQPRSLDAPDAAAGFVVTGSDHLLATDRGGDIGEPSELALSLRRRRLGQPGVVAIKGTLTPARGGETVVVSKREGPRNHWLVNDTLKVSSGGKFTVFWNVTETTRFVAQWSGDDTRAGAGSNLVTVRVANRQP